MVKSIIILLFIFLSLFSSGCVTTTLLSVTDPRPETFHKYTSAWIGQDELIMAYETDRGNRWTTFDLNQNRYTNTFSGLIPTEEKQSKRNIPITVSSSQHKFTYHRSRFERDLEGVNQLGKIFLIGDPQHYHNTQHEIQIIIEPVGNSFRHQDQNIPTPKMLDYRPGWTYPARIVGLPLAFCIDVVTIPLWFVSYTYVSIRF
ncbi:hypothetical protein [Candidatus Uabimicrobium sp. HlEnr_7]|uniref:hypothetical protein n=1 Tax=Candidatus Uabimicrobium helgolandensis TaxID=3095367 RepID=UPI003556E873